MTTASKIFTMVYKMVIFDENNKSIQIKRFLSKGTRVPHAKFYICKKVIFFENFDYRATLIKIRTFLKKIDSYLENINSQDVLKGLDSTKFLEILHSNKTPNKFSNHQLTIAFKHTNFVREPF